MALQDVLDDPSKQLDFIFEVTGTEAFTGVVQTFYYSVHGRYHTSADATGEVDVPPLLQNPGGFSIGLSADNLFTGTAEASARQVVLNNEDGPQNLNHLKNWQFNDGAYVIKAGERGAAYSTFEPVVTGTITKEPTVQRDAVTFAPGTLFDRLEGSYPLEQYLGHETGINLFQGIVQTDPYTATDTGANDIFDLESFSIGFKYYQATQGGNFDVLRKDNAYRASVDSATGQLELYVTFGGTEQLLATSPNPKPLLHWRNYIAGYDAESGVAYAGIMEEPYSPNGVTTNEEAPTDGADNSADDVTLVDWLSGIGTHYLADIRLYDSHIEPSELFNLMAEKSDLEDPRLVASWRFDDGTGSTATDYSDNGRNATASGSTTWLGTGMGNDAILGRVKGRILGQAYNLPVDLVSENWAQYIVPFRTGHFGFERIADNDNNQHTLLKSRGVAVAYGADQPDWSYDQALGMWTNETGSLWSEPVTLEHLDTVTTDGNLTDVLGVVLTGEETTDERPPFAAADVEYGQLFPRSYQVGHMVEDGDTREDVLSGVLSPIGCNLHYRADGKVRASLLTNALTPSPMLTSVLANPEVNFGNIGALSAGPLTVWCWFRISTFGTRHTAVTGIGQGDEGGHYLIAKTADANETANLDYKMFVRDDGRVVVRLKEGLSQPYAILKKLRVRPERWYFVCFQTGATGFKWYWRSDNQGKLRSWVDPDFALVSFTTATTENVTIGHAGDGSAADLAETQLVGAVAYAGVSGTELTKARLSSLSFGIEDGSATDLDLYIPLNEGYNETTVNELHTPTTGTVAGGDWAPRHSVRIAEMDVGAEITTRRLTEPCQISVRFRRNYAPMVAADIGGVSATGSFTYVEGGASEDTITRSSGSFITDGIGTGALTISGTGNNNKRVLVGLATDTTLYLPKILAGPESDLVDEGPVTSTLTTVTDRERTALQREWEAARIHKDQTCNVHVDLASPLQRRRDAVRTARLFDRRLDAKAVYHVPGDRRHMLLELEDEVWLTADEPGLKARNVGLRVAAKEVDFATGRVALVLWGTQDAISDDAGLGDIIATDAAAGDVAATSDDDVFRATGGPKS